MIKRCGPLPLHIQCTHTHAYMQTVVSPPAFPAGVKTNILIKSGMDYV